jgi:hypothetical protein
MSKKKLGPRAAAARVRKAPEPPAPDALRRSHQILKYAHDSADSLLDGFNDLMKARGPGAPTDEEQDLLRAMLLLSTAGLDACAKQLIRDALPVLVTQDDAMRKELLAFASRRLQKTEGEAGTDTKFLAELLIGSPEQNLIENFIRSLTSGSLQSTDELWRIASALGVREDKKVKKSISGLQAAFEARNQIAHEMDIDFDTRPRNRRGRRRDDMVSMTNSVLAAADAVLYAVAEKLS